ncbi:agmatinase family protein [Cyclobacterium xiamenense]|uniref:agmatinase family protein n=1 Tax=Cyclobacterium xiamenense TaxID=1297121 RepID=UPI0012B765E0|nr:agmatinase family protein [Cyclobacterium xiamenense]
MSANPTSITNFDPNGLGYAGKLFGLPFEPENSQLLILPVPWEVTVSYRSGTAGGPAAILEASVQVDLFQEDIRDAWKLGLSMLPLNPALKADNDNYRLLADKYIQWLQKGSPEADHERFAAVPDIINAACRKMNDWVTEQAEKQLDQGKLVGLLGGDHSTPLGLVQAIAKKHESFGILQIDAHADLRPAYEGFDFSHASIAYNFLKIPQVQRLVQVGVRDVCEQEWNLGQSDTRCQLFTDGNLKEQLYGGNTWEALCREILAALPEQVYLSIDIDGLIPQLCPHTGTPVPGGLDYQQLMFLIKMLVRSGRKLIGFDLVEVAPGSDGGEWDANVGARILYRIANLTAVSQGKLHWG